MIEGGCKVFTLQDNSHEAIIDPETFDRVQDIEEFDETLWCSLVDYMTVERDGNIVFTMTGGTIVKV